MFFITTSIILIAASFFFLKKKIALRKKSQHIVQSFSSLPSHYAYCFSLWTFILALAMAFGLTHLPIFGKFAIFVAALPIIAGVTFYLFLKQFNAKKHLEKFTKILLMLATTTGIIVTILITISILFEAIKFFKITPIFDFLFGLSWNPQVAVHEGQGLSDSSFGMIPVFLGTILITLIAIVIAVPLGIFAAIYLSEYGSRRLRDILKPILEILAGIPTVVYGYFAATAIAPFFKNCFAALGIEIAAESALAAGFVMGIMIIPFILSLSDDAINSVPTALKDGALALGSTKSEMIRKVILVVALPSIISSILLAISRAIGETMIVTMAAGLVAKLTFNPLDSVTTATAQIVTLLVGDQESDSPKTLAAFALGLVLFIMTLIFNIIALVVVKKYKEKYE